MLMVSSGRVARALGAILALQWLQTLSAEMLEEDQECKGRKKLVQTATKVSLATRGQSDLRSTAESNFRSTANYCLEKEEKDEDGRGLKDCWATKPSASTAPCTADSGATVCKCSEADCQFEELSKGSKGSLAVCAQKITFFQNGVFDSNMHSGWRWIEGTGIEVYCYNMVKTEGWSNLKHIMKWGSDPPAEKHDTYYHCIWDYHWNNNDKMCYRTKRYLGEKCWKHADCEGHKESGHYNTVCRDGKCSPRAWKPRKSCGCPLSGRLACNSKPCDGTACLTVSRGSSGYCDLTGPGWFY